VAAAETAHMTEVSTGEMSPAVMEREAIAKAVVETAPSDEDRTAEAKAAVIRPIVAVVAVVAAPIWPRVVIVAGIRITGCDSADHSGCDGRAGIVTIAVNIAAPVSLDVVTMTGVAICNVSMHAMHDTRVSGMLVMMSHSRRVSGRPIMVSDGRRICDGK
jgi:hypothetical protein